MPAYDHSYSPPAPIAWATLRSPETGATVTNVPMLLYAGADLTLVPRTVVGQLGVWPTPDRHYELMGLDGNRSLASIVNLDLILDGKAYRGPYLLSEDAVGVIGRNVLNHLSLEFDGPALEWNVSK